MLEEYATEDQHSVVLLFCGQRYSMQRIFIRKYFLFTVGSVCRLKRFTTGWQMFRWWRSVWNGGAEVAETTVERLEYDIFYVLYPFVTYLLNLRCNLNILLMRQVFNEKPRRNSGCWMLVSLWTPGINFSSMSDSQISTRLRKLNFCIQQISSRNRSSW
jgi:hypothetical protein